jgi:hypothetical protein
VLKLLKQSSLFEENTYLDEDYGKLLLQEANAFSLSLLPQVESENIHQRYVKSRLSEVVNLSSVSAYVLNVVGKENLSRGKELAEALRKSVMPFVSGVVFPEHVNSSSTYLQILSDRDLAAAELKKSITLLCSELELSSLQVNVSKKITRIG